AQPGHLYQAGAWVRSGSASSIGKPVRIRLSQIAPTGESVALWSSCPVALTADVQFVSVSGTATEAGGTLGVGLVQAQVAQGDAYAADAVSIIDQAPPSTQALELAP
ncbi:unnamed protein product, partial [Phaeothamnion confervicola]